MDANKQPISISITIGTIIKAILIFLVLYFLFLIQEVLAILFVAIILSIAVDPWVDWMHKFKIPRSVGILFIYLVMFSVIALAIYLIIPPIATEISELANNFPRYAEKIISTFSTLKNYSIEHGILDQVKNSLGTVSANLQAAAGGIFTTVTGIFGGIFSFFLILMLTFYMVVEENAIKKLVWSIAPEKHQVYVMQLINRIQKKIGLWLRGQLILCLVIFVLSYIGLLILGVKYALMLALIASITELVPYIGPIIGAIPAVVLAFAQSPMLAVFVVALYYGIQLVENNILTPKIMEKAVGINPIISIVALLVGFKVAGVVGAILSIPVATAVSVFVKDVFDSKGEKKDM